MMKHHLKPILKRHFNRRLRLIRNLSYDIFNPTIEHQSLRDTVKAFTKNEVEPQAFEYNKEEKLNKDLLKKCGDLGLLGLTVDEKYGGSECDAIASCIVHEELSMSDPAFCLSYLAHSLLFANNLNFNGNHFQKKKYLPQISSGDMIGGMCMSESDAGTDVLGMTSNAVLKNGKYILNGKKMWITNGCINDTTLGDIFLVYAKTPENSSSSIKNNKNISLFIVEKGMKGFKLGQRIKNKLGMRASTTAELVFDNVEIPIENLVGIESKAMKCMMRNLEIERLGLAAMSCGIARRSLLIMTEYAKNRKSFGLSISTYGQIQKYIGRSYADLLCGRTLVYHVAGSLNLNKSGNRLDTDAVKLYCSEMGKRISDNAIQVLGGNGYISDYIVERLWRDSKLLEIGGGTLESHEKNIINELIKH